MAAARGSGSLRGSIGGGGLPQITKSNPITGSNISAWGKSTSFQTTSQAAQLDLFYKKPGAQAGVGAGAGAAASVAGAVGPTSAFSASLKGGQQQALQQTVPAGGPGSASFHGVPLQQPLKPQREEMASMYGTGIANTAAANAGRRGAEGGYCFVAEWFDTTASVVRKFHFLYFPLDTSVEMFDIQKKRTFLKRCPFPTLALKDLHVGATISVYGRQLKLVAFGDDYTRQQLEDVKARTLALVRPEAYGHAGKIIDSVLRHGLTVSQLKLCRLTQKEAADFTGSEAAGASLAGKPVIALELVGPNAQQALSAVSGSNDAKADNKAQGGASLKHVMASGSGAAAAAELSFFFEQPRSSPALLNGPVTVLVIRPHAVAAGATGQIIDAVLQSGFEITAAESFHLDKTAAEEFLEVYKGVLPEYSAQTEQMASGTCIALELALHSDPNAKPGAAAPSAVDALRALCGPIDPVIGKHIRPNSLRARFGVNRVQNAVHCTDLPEDGPLESEFFFSILQKK